MNALFFWLFSAGMIGFGLAVVLNRNPVASALSFAFTIVFMSALFVMLNAFFLAAVQILVTAGAVMVLFLFIIMLLDVGASAHRPRRLVWLGCSLLLALGFIYLIARTLDTSRAGLRTTEMLPEPPATTLGWIPARTDKPVDDHTVREVDGRTEVLMRVSNDDTHRIGRLLFTRYVAPFEVTSLLILIATIGVIVLCKEEPRSVTRPPVGKIVAAAEPPRPKPEPAPSR
jgi:NADH-quinone oxidoreductase subunit J